MDIGNRLKIARSAIGYTLQQAGEESGIGISSLSEFENSKREPKFSQLSTLARVYRKSVDFFLSDQVVAESLLLWRDEPDAEEEKKRIEARFRQLCEQYHRLELCTGQIRRSDLPKSEISDVHNFGFPQAESFAHEVQKKFALGEIPGASLKQVLEETYHAKIFYLDFKGSAISTNSPVFGPAILLNKHNKPWRRTFDLGHELFHVLTWNIFRSEDTNEPGELEEKLANAFASVLLMPEESLKERITQRTEGSGQLKLDQLEDIAREFDVSTEALMHRIATIFYFKKEDRHNAVEAVKKLAGYRKSNQPETLSARYCDLAQRALREGKLSLMQFAKYMDISYKKAREYLTEDEDFTDETISISIT